MKCFADLGIRCDALKVKNCKDCKFYKSEASQLKVVIQDTLRDINSYRDLIPGQILKTLKGQVFAGDVDGARKGLDRAKKMRCL